VKFSEKYIAEKNERIREEQEKFRTQNKKAREFLRNFTGKILYRYEYNYFSPNESEHNIYISIFTFNRGRVTAVENVYTYENSVNSDIYYVVDNGGPGYWGYVSGDENAVVEYSHTISESDCNYYGHKFYADEELGYWKIVESWFNKVSKKYWDENKYKYKCVDNTK
jgi:hypothetical protein